MNYLSYDEIHGQHAALQKTADYVLGKKEEIRSFFQDVSQVIFLASGSSYWMSLSAALTFKVKTNINTSAVKAGDVVLCPEEYERGYTSPVLFCPSRSGFTGEVLKAIEILKGFYPQLRVFSIVEYPDSPLGKTADLTLDIPFANEESVCQTRSFSCLYAASLLISDIVAGKTDFAAELKDYLSKAPSLYTAHSHKIRELINDGKIKSVVSLGSGRQYGVAIEGAYIIIEMAEYNANYYQLLEYRHGPIVTADSSTAVFIFSSLGNEGHQKKIAEEAKKAGARVYIIAEKNQDYGDFTFSLEGDYSRELTALHGIFCMQAFAYHYSVHLGKNPDSPGELVPYIVI